MRDIHGAAASRRSVLALAGAAGAALATSSAASAATKRLDLSIPVDQYKAFMLMRAALDDRLVMGCVSGVYYGVIDAEMRPLYGVVAATFARYRARPDGGFDGVSAEVPFFTDLETGKVLDTWRNPYTNEDVVPAAPGYPPAAIVITPTRELRVPNPAPGLVVSHRSPPPEAMGEDVWFVEETMTSITVPGGGKPRRYNEVVTLHARRSDLEAPGAMRVPCQTGFQSVVDWRAWQKMGDRQGHLLASGYGRYGVPIGEAPAAWLAAVEVRRPGLLKDPGALLEPLWSGRA